MKRRVIGRSVVIAGVAMVPFVFNMQVASATPGAKPLCDGRTATIVAQAGHTNVNGTNGDDIIYVGSGVHVVFGNGGNDRICSDSGSGTNTIYGGTGDDTILVFS